MKNETSSPGSTPPPTGPSPASTGVGTPRRRWKVAAVVAGVVVGLPAAVIGGYVGYLKVSGTPLIDEWSCEEGMAPVSMPEGGSYCETEGAALPQGDTWHPLGNRPEECVDRWGWERAYMTWATDDPQDPGYEVGCLRKDAELPTGWTLVPTDAEESFVPEGANPAYAH